MYCPVCRSDYPEDWKVCPKDTTHLLRSAQIGKYKIEGLLGTGGMGAVYRAVNPDTRAKVALKIMNPAVASAESARARFQREAAAVAALRTAHVVKVFDFGAADDGTLYLVMELLDGHSLREEIQPAPDTMDLARVQLVLDGALKGLAAAHKAGIVHRDLKPENVFVADTDDGEIPKLLDFGIARVRTKDSDLTLTGSLMGTAGYMAIEQVAPDAGEIGPWSDVYAMGAILYEMLSGTAACSGETVTAVLQKVLRHDIVPLEELRPGLPAAVYALVDRCMSPDPTARPQDAEAMRNELVTVRLVPAGTPVPAAALAQLSATSQVGLLATAPSKDTVPSKPPTVEDPPPPRKKLNVGALVALAAFAGLGAYLGVRHLNSKRADERRDAGVSPADAAPVADASIDVAIVASPSRVPPEMLAIPAGRHDLGEPVGPHAAALPPTVAEIGEYWIDRVEVSLEVVRAILADPEAAGVKGDAPGLPARNVTWAQANAVCRAQRKRLPTELEWEAAARTTPQDPSAAALMRGTAKLTSTERKECSDAGLCDMLGSVLEWTSTDGPKRGTKIVRGASFTVSPDAGWAASIHFRTAIPAGRGDAEVGFRCVKEPE
ncbi:MAG: protein kinase [Deltaproteobacteria bacterium]|nr:protein kinase [Deltaproteobacteria bacterium]